MLTLYLSSKRAVDVSLKTTVSLICKLLESLLRDHNMVDFLTRHSIINQTQHGFLKGRSCLTNLLDFMEHISK